MKGLANRGESIDLANLVSAAGDNKIVDLVNQTLMIAIRDKASDVHFEPFEDEFKVRYRIDGVLYEMHPLPKHLAMAVCSRVKVMSKLDIAERRLPQDGRIELTIGDTPISIIGLGRVDVSSDIRVPRPPARMTAFINRFIM